MIVFEKVTKIAFAVLFGWVIVLLAFESAARRRFARRRRAALEAALCQHPQLRPTTEFESVRAEGPGAKQV